MLRTMFKEASNNCPQEPISNGLLACEVPKSHDAHVKTVESSLNPIVVTYSVVETYQDGLLDIHRSIHIVMTLSDAYNLIFPK